MLHQTFKEWLEFVDILLCVRLEGVEPDKDDREEDDVDQDEDNNGDASPLQPKDLPYAAIYCSG